ncbi:MAG TPA: hypothetical protein VGM90_28705 [Kofleriaceae bacterium]|jgi:hypothetical protein
MTRVALLAAVLALSATALADDDPIAVEGEIIEVHGTAPRTTPPQPQHYNSLETPPYSDHAILSDAWTRAWLVLELDETGTVARVKFLKKPGYDLEKIALAQVFGQKFSPALDADGKPMRTRIVWKLEWPSAWWLNMWGNPRNTVPMTGWPPHRADASVPCRGTAPLSLGSMHPVYKDCSQPDLSKVDQVAWIYPPAQKS